MLAQPRSGWADLPVTRSGVRTADMRPYQSEADWYTTRVFVWFAVPTAFWVCVIWLVWL